MSRLQAYIIKVSCRDGSNYHIYRRYSQFDQMQNALEKRFLIEAGSISAKDRVLPHLPAKKYFGRSAVREVTEKRLPSLNTYLLSLFSLPDKIRYDSIVTAFTRPTPDDLEQPYTGKEAYKNSSAKPERPPVPHTKPLRPGLPPTSKPSRPPPAAKMATQPMKQLKPVNNSLHSHTLTTPTSSNGKGKALYDYTAMHEDELSFKEGDFLSLLELVDAGAWWKAGFRGRTGLAPGNYVEVLKKPVVQNMRDRLQESDEWDSSEDEEGPGAMKGSIFYYYNKAPRSVEVATELIDRPNYTSLYRAVQKQLHRHDIMLNYRDSDGDLVQLIEQEDMALLSTDAMPPPTASRQSNRTKQAPWAIYITSTNDTSVYNTATPS